MTIQEHFEKIKEICGKESEVMLIIVDKERSVIIEKNDGEVCLRAALRNYLNQEAVELGFKPELAISSLLRLSASIIDDIATEDDQ